MRVRARRHVTRGLALAAIGAVFVAAVGAVPGIAAEPSGPADCPDIFPVDQVTDGMLATGWTATGSSGGSETVEPFAVEVLGVLEDGIAPGRDMIIIEASGPTIGNNGGGIWAGMSGSPVYHDGELLGAVAYGLSWGPSKVGGVTPAEYMVDIPTSETSSAPSKSVPLTRAERSDIASETGTSTDEVGDSFEQLKMPIGVSGASSRGRAELAEAVERENLPLIPHLAGTYGSGTVPDDLPTTDTPPEPGESFAAALSFGDVTLAGVGTTTMVCDGRALAFGHPFFWEGETTLGGAKAEAITIVPDRTFGSYKLSNIGAAFGTVKQDRLAGISAIVGDFPDVVPIESTITDLDMDDTRTGQTLAVDSEYLPYIAFVHNLSTSDVVVDRIGQGSSSTSWTLSGTRGDGVPWTVTRTNRYASEWDITYESVYEIQRALYRILAQEYEEVTLDQIQFGAEYEKEVKKFKIKESFVSKNGGDFRAARKIVAKPGDVLNYRVLLVDLRGNEHTEETSFVVPNRFRRAYLTATSGEWHRGSIECFTNPDDCYSGPTDTKFDKLLAKIANGPKNNDLLMSFDAGRRRGTTVVRTQEQVVGGYEYIRVVRPNSDGEEGVAGEPID